MQIGRTDYISPGHLFTTGKAKCWDLLNWWYLHPTYTKEYKILHKFKVPPKLQISQGRSQVYSPIEGDKMIKSFLQMTQNNKQK